MAGHHRELMPMMHVDLTETMLLYNTLYRMPEADPQWQLEWRGIRVKAQDCYSRTMCGGAFVASTKQKQPAWQDAASRQGT